MFKVGHFKGIEFPLPDGVTNVAQGAVESYNSYLEEVLAVEGFETHRLLDSYGGHPIYGFSLGNVERKPMIFIDGCIHNSHEWRSSYWVMHFMEVLNNPSLYPEVAKEIIKLKMKYSFYIIPVVAPDCFEASTQGKYSFGNDRGVNIPHNFDYNYSSDTPNRGEFPFSETESQNIRDIILQHKPVMYINCHTWGGGNRHVVRKPINPSHEIFYRDWNDSMNLSSPISQYRAIGGHNPDPSSYNWASEQVSSQGRKILSNVLEIGDRIDSLTQSQLGVTGFVTHLIQADNYLTNNRLTVS